MKTHFLLLAVFAAAWALPARAEFNVGGQGTSGSLGYKGMEVSATASAKLDPVKDDGPSISLKPQYNQFSSNESTGTSKSYQARLGYENGALSAGATFERSPLNDGYSNTQWGADLSYEWRLGGEKAAAEQPKEAEQQTEGDEAEADSSKDADRQTEGEEAAAREDAEQEDEGPRVGLGASWMHTRHSDLLQAIAFSGRQFFVAKRASAAIIGQNDYEINAFISYWKTRLSGSYTVSKYNQNLAAISARSAGRARLAGLNSLVQGFPDNDANLRLDYLGLPVVSPYVSYTHTRFELGIAPANDYSVGFYADAGPWEFMLSYDTLKQSGSPNQNHVTLGAEFKF